jgi:hypothetical protein
LALALCLLGLLFPSDFIKSRCCCCSGKRKVCYFRSFIYPVTISLSPSLPSTAETESLAVVIAAPQQEAVKEEEKKRKEILRPFFSTFHHHHHYHQAHSKRHLAFLADLCSSLLDKITNDLANDPY